MDNIDFKTGTDKNGNPYRVPITRKTLADFVAEANEIWHGAYDYSDSIYKDKLSPITIYCPKHDIHFTVGMAQNHVIKPGSKGKATGCPVCSYENQYGKQYGPEWRETLRLSPKQNRVGLIRQKHSRTVKTPEQIAAEKAEREAKAEARRREKQAYIDKWQAKDFLEARFKERVFQMYGNDLDTSLVDYQGNDKEVTLICHIHGKFRINPRTLLVGKSHSNGKKTAPHGCWKCCGITQPSERPAPMTADEFFDKMQEIYGDRLDFSHSVFRGINKPVDYECKIHGHQHNGARTLLSGDGCDYCSGRKFYGPDFVRLAREVHGDKYNYSQVGEIKNKVQIVTIGCPVHGPYPQRVDLHLLGHGCPECYGQSNKWDTKERARRFFEKAHKMHGDQFDYSEANYVDKRTPIRIRCKKHDYWFTCRPDEHVHVRSAGCCPYCTAPKSELEVMLWLDAQHIPYIHNKPIPNNDPTLELEDLKADFYLENGDERIIIETNGPQHYKEINFFHNNPKSMKKNKRDFKKQQHRDQYLRQYCKEEGITLLEIPFTEYDRIPSVLYEFFKDRDCYKSNS